MERRRGQSCKSCTSNGFPPGRSLSARSARLTPTGHVGAGNIVSMGTDSFGYDLRSRLTSASYEGIGDRAFSYDRYGNLLSDGVTTFWRVSGVNPPF